MDQTTNELLELERRFDDALISGDADSLESLLADDFVLNDFMGGVVSKADLLGHIRSGSLKFHGIVPHDLCVRRYNGAGLVTGWTEMRAEFRGAISAVRSRFLHVHVNFGGPWRMVSAQGTIIPDSQLGS